MNFLDAINAPQPAPLKQVGTPPGDDGATLDAWAQAIGTKPKTQEHAHTVIAAKSWSISVNGEPQK